MSVLNDPPPIQKEDGTPFNMDRWIQAEEKFLELFFGTDDVERFSTRLRNRQLKVGVTRRHVQFDKNIPKRPASSRFHPNKITLDRPTSSSTHKRPFSGSIKSRRSTSASQSHPDGDSWVDVEYTLDESMKQTQDVTSSAQSNISLHQLDTFKIMRPKTADLSQTQQENLKKFKELDQLVFIRPSSGRLYHRLHSPRNLNRIASSQKLAVAAHSFRPWSSSNTRWLAMGTRISSARQRPDHLDILQHPMFAVPRHSRPLSKEAKYLLFSVLNDFLDRMNTEPIVKPAVKRRFVKTPPTTQNISKDPSHKALSQRIIDPAELKALATAAEKGDEYDSAHVFKDLSRKMDSRHFDEMVFTHKEKSVNLNDPWGAACPELKVTYSRISQERAQMLESLEETGFVPIPDSLEPQLHPHAPLNKRHFKMGQKFKEKFKVPKYSIPRRLSALKARPALPGLVDADHHTESTKSHDSVESKGSHLSLVAQSEEDDIPSDRHAVGSMFPLDYFLPVDHAFELAQSGKPIKATAKCYRLNDQWTQCEILNYDKKANAFQVKWTQKDIPPELKGSYTAWITRADMLLPGESLKSRSFQLKHAAVLRSDFERSVAINQFVGLARPLLEQGLPVFPTALVYEMAERVLEHLKMYQGFDDFDANAHVIENVIFSLCEEIKNDYHSAMIQQIVLQSQRFMSFLDKAPCLDLKQYRNEHGQVIKQITMEQSLDDYSIDIGSVKEIAKNIDPYIAMTKHQGIVTTVFKMSFELERFTSILNIRDLLKAQQRQQQFQIINQHYSQYQDYKKDLLAKELHSHTTELQYQPSTGRYYLDPKKFIEIVNVLGKKLRIAIKIEVPNSVQVAFLSCLKNHGVVGFEAPKQEKGSMDGLDGVGYYKQNTTQLGENASITNVQEAYEQQNMSAIHEFFTPEETFDYIKTMMSNLAKADLVLFVGNGMKDLYRLFRHHEILLNVYSEFNQELAIQEEQTGQLDVKFNVNVATDIIVPLKKAVLGLLDPIVCNLPAGTVNFELANKRLLEELFTEVMEETVEEGKNYLSEMKNDLVPKIIQAKKIPRLVLSTEMLLSPNAIDDAYETYISQCKSNYEDMQHLLSYINIHLASPQQRGLLWISTQDLKNRIEIWCQKLMLQVFPDMLKSTLITQLNAFLKRFDDFLVLNPVTSYEQTREATSKLQSMRDYMTVMARQVQGIVDVKSYMDTLHIELSSAEYNQFYRAFAACGDIQKLWEIRDRQLQETIQEFRDETSVEIDDFLLNWMAFEELFETNVVSIDNSNVAAEAKKNAAETMGGRKSSSFLVASQFLSNRQSSQFSSSLWKKASSTLQTKAQTSKETKETLAATLNHAATYKAMAGSGNELAQRALHLLDKIEAIRSVPRSDELILAYKRLKIIQVLLNSVTALQDNLSNWTKSPMAKLQPEQMKKATQDLLSKIEDCEIPAIKVVKRGVSNFLSHEFLIISHLKYEYFRPWHWERIREILYFPQLNMETHNVLDVLSKNARNVNIIDLLKEVEEAAANELRMLKTLMTIESRFMTLQVELEEFGESELVIIKSFDYLINIVEGDILALGMLDLNNDPHYHDSVKALETRLIFALNSLKEWDHMQPLMVKCSSFFDTEEAKARLVLEMRRFKALQRAYSVLIKNVKSTNKLGPLVDGFPDLCSAVGSIKEGLIKLMSDIQGWVDKLRTSFPRLYFISDDELLDLLSVAKDPSLIQKHLVKCFDFAELMHRPDGHDHRIIGLKSQAGEVLQLLNGISTKSSVEFWLSKLEQEMKNSMKEILWTIIHDLKSKEFQPASFYEFYSKRAPSQICMLASRILHTMELEQYCQGGQIQNLKKLAVRSKDCISKLMEICSKHESGLNAIFKSFIALEIYYRDWQQELITAKVKNLDSFVWIKGVRYYYRSDEMTVTVRQLLNSSQYGYEYLSPRQSPCIDAKFGVFAHGSESTGKKTAFQEFAKVIGKFMFVFTCDQRTSMAVIGRIITGIVTSGVFCILDKLQTQSSSNISQIIQSISLLRERSQQRENAKSIIPFFGRNIRLPSPLVIGCFATIDNASAGDKELSGILHTQMRSISFITPDAVSIAQGLLTMGSFVNAEILGSKLAKFLDVAKYHLSVQEHYDYSLRTLKVIVKYASNLKRIMRENDEAVLLCHAIIDYLKPRLVYEDLDIFHSLLKRIFNFNVSSTDITDAESYSIQKLLTSSEPEELFKAEIHQIVQTVESDQHCLLVGSSTSGKSTIIKKAASLMKARSFELIPDAYPEKMFFGHVDKNGFETGILETVLEQCHKADPNYKRNWIVFDSDIQNEWVDRISSLVDEFRVASMCFCTGNKVTLPKMTTVFVETQSLRNASVHFVGRFNLIYLKNSWSADVYIDLWFASPEVQAVISNDMKRVLTVCFSNYLPQVLEWTQTQMKIQIGNPAMLASILRLLKALLFQFQENNDQPLPTQFVQDVFIYALIWSVGGLLSLAERSQFQKMVVHLLENNTSSTIISLLDLVKDSSKDGIFGCFFDFAECNWQMNNSKGLFQPLKLFSRLLMNNQCHVLLLGEHGTRKTSLGVEILEKFENASIYYEPLTKKSDGMRIIQQFQKVLALDEQLGIYLPPNEKKFVLFVDDLQEAQKIPGTDSREMWEFLRGVFDKKGYWSKSKTFRSIDKVSFITAYDFVTPSEIELPEKMLRNMSAFYVCQDHLLEHEIPEFYMTKIRLMERQRRDVSVTELQILMASTIDLYKSLKRKIPIRSETPLITFSMNDVDRILTGLFEEVMKAKKNDVVHLLNTWLYESHRVYLGRVADVALDMYTNTIQRIILQNFQTQDIRLHQRRAAVEKVNLAQDIDGNGNQGFRATVTRGIKKDQPDYTTLSNHIADITLSLQTKDRFIRDITCNESWLRNFCLVDDTLGQSKSTVLLLSHIGMDIVYDLVRVAGVANDMIFRLFKFQNPADIQLWKIHFKRVLDDVSTSQNPVIFCVSFEKGIDYSEVFDEIQAFLDGGRIQHLYSAAEYDDFVNKFHATVMKSDIEIVIDQRQEENSIFQASLQFAKHLASKIKLVLCFDADDIQNQSSISQFSRIGMNFVTGTFRILEFDELVKYATSTLKIKYGTFPEYLPHIASRIFYEAQQLQMANTGAHSLTLFEMDVFLDLTQRLITKNRSKLYSLHTSYAKAQAGIGLRMKDLKSVFQLAQLKLENFPETIKQKDKELKELASNIENLKITIATMKQAMLEREEALAKMMQENDEELAQAPLEESKKAFQNASKVLASIKKDDIEDMKASVLPPPAVLQISEALCVVFDKPSSWLEAKKLISSSAFMQKILNFDVNTVNDAKMDKLLKTMDLPLLKPERLRSLPIAPRYMCLWLRALTKLVKENKLVKTDTAAAGKTRKLMEAKLLRLNGERADQERMQDDYRRLSREHKSLSIQHRELIGQYALMKETFAINSIFDQQEANPLRDVTEGQWIQQAFTAEENVAAFSDPEVDALHTKYQNDLVALSKVKEQVEEPSGENTLHLNNLKSIVENMTLPCIKELFSLATATTFEMRAREVLLHLIEADKSSTVDLIYKKLNERPIDEIALRSAVFVKDSRMVSPTPIAPFQACKGAILVRDLMESMYRYVVSSKGVNDTLEVTERAVQVSKTKFDQLWAEKYSHSQEFWTMESIISRIQATRKRIKGIDLVELERHVQMHANHPLINSLLKSACLLCGYDTTNRKLYDIVQENPTEFLDRLTQVDIRSPSALGILNEHVKPLCEYNNLMEYVEEKVSTMFVDILTMFPTVIKFEIFQYLQHRDICRSSCVSKTWNDAATHPAIWKYLSYSSGWGVAFNLPKKMDWKLFFSTVYVEVREKTQSIKERFANEMKGTVGMLAYKKMTSFLHHSPEYTNLERILLHRSQDWNDIVPFEVANECFIAVEDSMTKFLIQEAMSAGHRITSAKDAVNRKSSLRHRIANVVFEEGNSFGFRPKPVHSLIMNAAHRYGVLTPGLEKIRRKLNHGQLTAPFVAEITVENIATNLELYASSASEIRDTVYVLLAEYYKTIYAYHRGIQVGKYLQFQDRFYKSLEYVSSRLRDLQTEIARKTESLYGDALFKAALYSIACRFGEEERHYLLEQFENEITQFTPLIVAGDQDVFQDSEFFALPFIKNALDITADGPCNLLFIDPKGVASAILKKSLPLEKYSKIKTVEAIDDALLLQLQYLATIPEKSPLIVKHMDKLYDYYDEVAKFTKSWSLPVYLATEHSLTVSSQKRIRDFLCVDLTLSEEAKCAWFLDILIQSARPSFLVKKEELSREYADIQTRIDTEIDKIIVQLNESPSILQSDDVMMSIIQLKRNSLLADGLKHQKVIFIDETKDLMEPYRNMAAFVSDVYKVIKGLLLLDPCYHFSDQLFEHIVKESAEQVMHLPSDEALSITSKQVVDYFVDLIVKRVALGLPRHEQAKFFVLISTLKAKFTHSSTLDSFTFFTSSLSSLYSSQETTAIVSKWVASSMAKLADVQPIAFQYLEHMNHCYNDLAKIEELLQLKLDLSISAIFYVAFIPEAIRPNSLKLLRESSIQFQDGVKESFYFDGNQKKLVLTFSIQNSVRKIKRTIQSFDRAHIQLSNLSEVDKPDDVWRDKLKFAAGAGHWIYIILDRFWMNNLAEILHLSQSGITSFRLWIICPFHHMKKLPLWITHHFDVIYEEIPLEPRDVASVFMSKIVDGDIRNNAPLSTILYFLMRFHTSVLDVSGKLPPSLHFDGMNFGLALSCFGNGTRQGVHTRLILEVILKSMYLLDVQSKLDIQLLENIWQRDLELYDGCFKRHPVETSNFETLFTKIESVLFPPRTSHITMSVDTSLHIAAVRHLCGDLCRLLDILPQHEASTTLSGPSISKLNQLRRMVVDKVNVRRIFERNRLHSTAMDLLLREEATNVRQLIDECIYALNHSIQHFSKSSFSLDHCFESLQRMFPTFMKMDPKSWILAINKMALFVQNWIEQGAPKVMDVGKLISVEAFLDNRLDVRMEHNRSLRTFSLVPVTKKDLSLLNVAYPLALSGLLMKNAILEDNRIMDIAEGRVTHFPFVNLEWVHEEAETVTGCKLAILDDRLNWKVSRIMQTTQLGRIRFDTSIPAETLEAENVTVVCRQDQDTVEESTLDDKEFYLAQDDKMFSKSRLTLLVISTQDAHNERHHFFNAVVPKLKDEFSSVDIQLDFVDFKWGKQTANISLGDQVQAIKTQMKRTDAFILILGQQLGNKMAYTKHTTVLDKTDDVYEVEWLLAEMLPFIKSGKKHVWYIRDKTFARSVPKSFRDLYKWKEPEMELKLDQMINRIKQASPEDMILREYPCHFSHISNRSAMMGGLEVLDEWMWQDIKTMISRIQTQTLLAPSRYAFDMTAFLQPHLDFVSGYLLNNQSLKQSLLSMVVVGSMGSGKTAILNRTSQQFVKAGFILLENTDRSWDGMIESEDMIRKMTCQLAKQLLPDSVSIDIPQETKELEVIYLQLLGLAATQRRKVAIVIDDVDKLKQSKGRDAIKWQPRIYQIDTAVWENTIWLFSASSGWAVDALKENHPHIQVLQIEALGDAVQDQMAERVEIPGLDLNKKSLAAFFRKSTDRSILHCDAIVKETISARIQGTLLNDVPSTALGLFDSNLKAIQGTKYGMKIIQALCALVTSRNGLTEKEIIDILDLSFIEWNLMYDDIAKLTCFGENGMLKVFHQAFEKAVQARYLTGQDEYDWHRKLAAFFIRSYREKRECKKITQRRLVDAAHHLVRGKSPVKDFVNMITLVEFVEAAYESGLGYELPELFSVAIGSIERKDLDSLKRIKDFLFFSQVNAVHLSRHPSLTFPLALNLRKALCETVKMDALDLVKKSLAPDSYLESFMASSDYVDFVPIGHHRSTIVRFTVNIFKKWGKCCLSVSNNGTIKAWNMDSYILIDTLLNKPLPPDSLVDCCFQLHRGEYVALGTKEGDVYVFDLQTKKMMHFLKGVYNGSGMLFWNERLDGLWHIKEKSLCWIPLADSKFTYEEEQETPLFKGQCEKVIARSFDEQKIAILGSKLDTVIILNTNPIREMVRFKQKDIDTSCIAQFSHSKSLFSVSRKDSVILVWNLGNHSRLSQFAYQSKFGKLRTMGFSADEKTLIACWQSEKDVLAIGNLNSGQWMRTLSIHDGCPVNHLCISTLHGEERLFGVKNRRVYYCDLLSVLSKTTHEQNDLGQKHKGFLRKLVLFQDGILTLGAEGGLYRWDRSKNILELKDAAHFSIELVNMCFIESLRLLIRIEGRNAILQTFPKYKTLLTVEHDSPVLDIVVNEQKLSANEIVMYSLTADSVLTAWKMILGDTHQAHHAIKLFSVDSVNKIAQLKSATDVWIVHKHFYVAQLDWETGKEKRIFRTWGSEWVSELHISQMHETVCFTTANALYVDFEMWSFGGTLGDNYTLYDCKTNLGHHYIGYSALEKASGSLYKTMAQGGLKSMQKGILVLLDLQTRNYLQSFYHPCKILFWDYLNTTEKDGSCITKWVATIGSDNILRIFDIGKRDASESTPVASFVLSWRSTCFAVCNHQPVMYVGDENGEMASYTLVHRVVLK